MDEYAVARHRLELLVSDAKMDGRNESTTRLHLIDPLLMDCLGWQPEEITTEDHVDGQRTDYQLGHPRARVVVEAKREALAFELPVGVTGRTVEIKTLMESPLVAAAIEQVKGYCQDRSIPIAVATNGHQFVAFLASRQDAVRPLDGKAVVFRSLADMLDDFKLLWTMLSPSGVAQAALQRHLGGASEALAPPQKLSARIVNYPGFRSRSVLETDLKILGQLFLLDIAGEREISDDFLKSCYCPSGALSQYALVSKEILRTRYSLVESVISDVEPVQEKKGVTPKLGAAVLASALSRRPVLLLGDVGVGKTIFLNHLLRIDATDVLQQALVLYLDFGSEPVVADDLNGFVAARLIEQLRVNYDIDVFDDGLVRAVYNAEINRFKRSVAGGLAKTDRGAFDQREIEMLEGLLATEGEHVGRCLEHLKATAGRSVVVVLDNVDQRPTTFQEEVFLIGQGIASRWPATVFIALRPSTFHESRLRGSLSGYHSRAFSVYPARIDEVVGRRLKFARRQLLETGRLESFPDGLSLDSSNLLAYVDVLIKAFDSDDALKELLDNLSGGNVRSALDFLNAFVGSAFVSTQRILDVAEHGDTYTIPLHEFFRAITYGDAEHYDPSTSPIPNVFDITEDDAREHFLLPSLILDAARRGEEVGGDRFFPVADLEEHGRRAGFRPEQIGAQLERAFLTRLLEASEGGADARSCRATTIGAYTVRRLMQMFSYIDAMIVDTPIVDPSTRAALKDVRPIHARIERAELFRAYLDHAWLGCADAGLAIEWPSVSHALDADLQEAKYRATRAANLRRSG
jgi:hypothetical protein